MRGLMILVTLALASAANAAPLACPATLKGKALEEVTVFDGPPAEMASLRPEDGRETNRRMRQTWDIAEIGKSGRQVHMACRYKGGAKLVLQAPKSAKVCTQDLLRLDNKGHYRPLSFSCR